MQMTYNHIYFFQIIHHQVSISNYLIVLMILKNGFFNNILLNTSKTTLLNLSISPTYFPPFLIDNIVIYPSPTASNLGVFFDSTLSFIPHITAITNSVNDHLFRIRKILKSITVSLTKTLVNSLALSRIY